MPLGGSIIDLATIVLPLKSPLRHHVLQSKELPELKTFEAMLQFTQFTAMLYFEQLSRNI